MPNALRRCTLHQFSKGNNQLYLYMLYKYKQLLIAHSIGLQRVRNRVCCWKWSSSPSASVQNRVQISVHSPVHESSPESRVQVLHQPILYRVPNCPFSHNWSRIGFDQLLCWHNFRIKVLVALALSIMLA